jgi:hypothetical protein
MLARRKSALDDETADGGLAHGEGRGRLVERRLAALGAFAVTINGDAVLVAQGTNPSSCPAVPTTGRLAGSVEHRSDCLVRHLVRQSAHQLNHLHIGGPSRLAGAVPLHH